MSDIDVSGIPGWFDFADIYDQAVAEASAGGILVEVGCAFGKSTAHLAMRAREANKHLTVYAVDPWDAYAPWDTDYQAAREELGGSFSAFAFYMRRARMLEHLRVVRAPSLMAARMFVPGSVDFVFIDADHTYGSLRADIAAWCPKVRPGGVISGHDHHAEFPGVEQAVREAFGNDYEVRGLSWWKRIAA